MSLYAEKFRAASDLLGELDQYYAYIDGAFLRGREAQISVWDHGYLYGDSVFEGVRAYEGRIFKLPEHLDRLFDSAKSIKINCPLSREELSEVVVHTFRRNEIRDGHGRTILSRGIGSMGLDPRKTRMPSVVVMTYPLPATYGEKPVRMITSSVRRKGPLSVDAKVKCSNYMDNILAKLQAIAAGTDEALMLDGQGFVAEATAENVFVVKRGSLATPFTTAALQGITRDTVIELVRAEGVNVEERNLTVHDLYIADEVFLTGTAAEIAVVGELDGRTIGSGSMGKVTTQVRHLYQTYARSNHGTPIFDEDPGR